MRRFVQKRVIRQHEIRVRNRDENNGGRRDQPRSKPRQSDGREDIEQNQSDMDAIRNRHSFGSIDLDRFPSSRFQLGETFCGVHEGQGGNTSSVRSARMSQTNDSSQT